MTGRLARRLRVIARKLDGHAAISTRPGQLAELEALALELRALADEVDTPTADRRRAARDRITCPGGCGKTVAVNRATGRISAHDDTRGSRRVLCRAASRRLWDFDKTASFTPSS